MIEAFFGLPGAGKTYAMTRKAIKFLRRGRDVYCNFDLKPSPRDRGRIIKFSQIFEVLNVDNAVIMIDEAGLVFPAQMWKDIPFEVVQQWREHRHDGVEMYYTAQDKQDVAAALRRVTQFANECQKFGPFMSIRTYGMRDRKKYGGSFHLFDSEIAKRYNSYGKKVARQTYIKSTYGDSSKGGNLDVKG